MMTVRMDMFAQKTEDIKKYRTRVLRHYGRKFFSERALAPNMHEDTAARRVEIIVGRLPGE